MPTGEPRHRIRRWILTCLALALVVAPSCAASFDSPSKVSGLRVLSVTVDKPYVRPGDDITLRMTVVDGAGDPDDPEGAPRPMQILWLAGCFNPVGDQYFLCFSDLQETFGQLSEGGDAPGELFSVTQALPSSSGVPDAHAFTFTIPDDIVSERPAPDAGPHYGIAYVFFAACAGQLAPTDLATLGGDVPEFPVACLDSDGNALGPDSFVPGYTQVYAFADERQNAPPELTGITLDGVPIPDGTDDIPVVQRCPVTAEQRRSSGCGTETLLDGCTRYLVKGTIGDEAEVDPEGVDASGEPLREAIWINYFADDGDLDTAVALVSDPVQGRLDAFETEWIPPPEPALVTLWAVVRDQRGGSSVVRRFVRVE